MSPAGDIEARRIEVDPRVYGQRAILGALYWLTDRAYVRLRATASDGFIVEIALKPDSHSDLDSLAGEFHNRLLDESLRVAISEETRGVRELIFAKAFV